MLNFNKELMLKMVKKDRLLKLVYQDLQKRGHDADSALEIIFNSYILDDSEMEFIYISEGN